MKQLIVLNRENYTEFMNRRNVTSKRKSSITSSLRRLDAPKHLQCDGIPVLLT